MIKRSLPSPPFIVSAPAAPVIISFAALPMIVLDSPLPTKLRTPTLGVTALASRFSILAPSVRAAATVVAGTPANAKLPLNCMLSISVASVLVSVTVS